MRRRGPEEKSKFTAECSHCLHMGLLAAKDRNQHSALQRAASSLDPLIGMRINSKAVHSPGREKKTVLVR